MLEMAPDAELVSRAQLGDRQALGQLLERHQAPLWRFTLRMCRSRQDAEDVLQEALTGEAAAAGASGCRHAAQLSRTQWLACSTCSTRAGCG